MEDVTGDITSRVGEVAAAHVPGSSIRELRPMAGGHSGVTLRGWLVRPDLPDVEVVLKMTPPGQKPIGRHDVLRQARGMSALKAVPGFRVPEVLLLDDDDPNVFAMALVGGQSAEPVLDGPNLAPEEADRRARAAARMLAALHRAPLHARGIAGEPVLSVGDELERWRRTMDAVPEELRPRAGDLYERLGATIPTPEPPVVLHGDYRLGNILCRNGDVQAVIDWEIWSVGDRRVDLGWFLLFCDAGNFPGVSTPAPGMPSARALLAEYERAAALTVSKSWWFEALASYKMAAIMGHNLRRHREGRHHDPYQETLVPTILGLVDHGLDISGSREAATIVRN